MSRGTNAMLVYLNCLVLEPDLLETVEGLLPCSVTLDAHLHATEDLFFASSEVNTELNNIAIVDRKWF